MVNAYDESVFIRECGNSEINAFLKRKTESRRQQQVTHHASTRGRVVSGAQRSVQVFRTVLHNDESGQDRAGKPFRVKDKKRIT